MKILKDKESIENYKKLIKEASNLTKENSNFDGWFSEVIRLYSLGTLDVPMTALKGKMPFWEHLHVPTEEETKEYSEDQRIIDLYKDLYEQRIIPSHAIDLMW